MSNKYINVNTKLIVMVACVCALAGARPARAQATVQSCLTVPTELDGYRLTETKAFEDTANGTSYKFSNGSNDRVTLFIYPVAPAARVGADVRSWVAAEGRRFKDLFPVGVQRGWWQAYTMAFDEPDSVAVGKEQIPGYLVAGATRRGDAVNVELEYVFGVCDRFVKIRATLDSKTWDQSPFPTFAKDLAAYLRQH